MYGEKRRGQNFQGKSTSTPTTSSTSSKQPSVPKVNEMSSLRLKPGTRCLLSNPAGACHLGDSLTWVSGLSGRVKALVHSMIQLEMSLKYKYIKDVLLCKRDGKALVSKLESFYLRMVQRWTVLNMIRQDPKLLANQLDVEMALNVKMMELWPSLLQDIATRLVPNTGDVNCEPRGLPWNRAKRKRLRRAKHIILHFYSGPNMKFWEKELSTRDTEVLCIDLLSTCKADVLGNRIYKCLLILASTGRVREVLGGPPCRTVSALRFQGDDGPGIVWTEAEPYGVSGISGEEQALAGDKGCPVVPANAVCLCHLRGHHRPDP